MVPFRLIDWIRIATDIELNYSNFDGFVILHGTDTMSYTSSALSFMLEDLGKTVVSLVPSRRAPRDFPHFVVRQVVTGAQIPMSQLRNDAVDNLLGALVIAGHYIIPGKDACCIAEIALECLSIFCRVLFVFQSYPVPGEQSVEDVVI